MLLGFYLAFVKKKKVLIVRRVKGCDGVQWCILMTMVKKQYFYSGGSLREFCRKPNELKLRAAIDRSTVGSDEALDLVYEFGACRSQEDLVRRHYIADRNNEEHYIDSCRWRMSVDSGYTMGKLGRHVAMKKLVKVYMYARSIGAGFLGTAYELLLHHAVKEAFAKRSPILLTMRPGSEYERIQIVVPHVERMKTSAMLSWLNSDKKRTGTPTIHSFLSSMQYVVMCQAFRSESSNPETILAYIQVTIQAEKTFKLHRLRQLNRKVDQNPNLAGVKRAFVVVGPDASVCETFTLHGAPPQDTYLTMVGCFDPSDLVPKQC